MTTLIPTPDHERRPTPGPAWLTGDPAALPPADPPTTTAEDGPGTAVQPYVFEGELVTPNRDATPAAGEGGRPGKAIALRRAGTVARRRTVHVITTARVVVTHPRTKTVAKGTARNLWYPVAGAAVVAQRWRDAHGAGRYERMMRAAEAVGDQEALREWEARDVAEKAARHQRVMDWVRSPLDLVKAGAVAVAAVVGLLLGLGVILAVGTGDAWQVIGPIVGLITAITWTAWFLAAYGALLLLGATAGALAYLWQVGRARTTPPVWIAPVSPARMDENVTPSKVVLALRNLGIAALTKAIKAMDDAGGAMLSPIRIAGCGVEVDVRLPPGVSTAEIQKLGRKLAENLDRHEYELFITIPAARTVRLWIADSGALDEPIGPSPLVIDPDGVSADIYTGRAPWGQDLRGQARGISLKQRHLLITGLSNQGKTASLRALVLWAMFDVAAEFRIADLKGVGDWHMFAGLATTLIEGPSDADVIAATEMLEEVVREMERRLTKLDKDRYPDGVTRDLARQPGSGFHPLFAVVDEAQQAFMCPVVDSDGNPYGGTKARSRYFMAARKIHNQGRAVNVHLWQGTQDPTDQNLPKLVREGAHIRASLVVGTEAQARMALGDKAVDGGAAPHLLRQGLDKGTVVLNGEGMELAPGETSLILLTHFIDGAAATELAERAKQIRRTAGHTAPANTADPEEERDLLAEALEVLKQAGRSSMALTDLREKLLAVAPYYERYSDGTTLGAAFGHQGVQVTTIKGHPSVTAKRIAAAIEDRELAADPDTHPDGEPATEPDTDGDDPRG